MKLEHYVEPDQGRLGTFYQVKTKHNSNGEYIEQGVVRATARSLDEADRLRVELNNKEYGGVE